MRALLTAAALSLLASSAVAVAAPKYAPADQYFGRMKLSYLGINNTFRDEGIRAGSHTTDSGIANKVQFADDALEAWAKAYPNDPQLSRSYFLASETYKKIWTKPAQEKAWSYMQLILKKFPTTFFGKTVKRNLEIGFTQHWYADAVSCDDPQPQAQDIAAPKPMTPKVRIEVPPCIPTPTPSPSPTPTEGASPSPTPTASFKPRAYERAAHDIEACAEDVHDVYAERGPKALDAIPGVGSGITKHLAARSRPRTLRRLAPRVPLAKRLSS